MANVSLPEDRIQQLEASIAKLSARITVLEKGKSSAPTTPAVPSGKPAIVQKRQTNYLVLRWVAVFAGIILLPVFSVPAMPLLGLGLLVLAIFWPWKKTVSVAKSSASLYTPPGATAPTLVPPTPATASAKPRVPSHFEQDLAKHWFSWLGIISLIVGVALLLNYVLFRAYGPLGSILTAYAVGLILFGLWAWLRKMYAGFAFTLQGGAWAILYLATFALHAIVNPPVQSAVTAGLFLLVVVAAMTVSALIQHSRVLTAGAFFLGFIAALTNPVTLFALTAMLGLSVGLIVVAIRQRWSAFILAGNIATYLVFILWLATNHVDLTQSYATALIFLIAEAILFGSAHWLMRADSANERQMVVAGTVANLTGFFVLSQYILVAANNNNSWVVTIFLAIIVALLGIAAQLTPSRKYLADPYLVFSITFLTVGFGEKFKGDTLRLAWIVEAVSVTIIGLLAKIKSTRYMGYVVSALVFIQAPIWMSTETNFGATTVPSRVVMSLIAILGFVLVAWTGKVVRSFLTGSERHTPVIYFDAAVLLGLWLLGLEVPHAWVSVAWSAIAAVAFVYGLARHSTNARVIGYLVALGSMMHWIGVAASETALAGALPITARLASGASLVIVLFGLSLFAQARKASLPKGETGAADIWSWAAVGMLAVVMAQEIPIRTLSIAWGLEGIVLYGLGFATANPTARRQGMIVLILTIAKVYIYDVQALATPYRILSFIILGIILLIIGFLYNRRRQEQPKTKQLP